MECQFLVNDNGEPQEFGSSWLGNEAKDSIDDQVKATAAYNGVDERALRPCWEKQIIRAVAPVSDPENVRLPMEWRLHGKVTTMGQLLIQLGSTRDLLAAC